MQLKKISLNDIDKSAFYITLLVWFVLSVYIFLFILLKSDPYKHTVTKYYWEAAYNWIHGLQLTKTGTGSAAFLYFPQSAILQIPFALFPFRISELLWRILNISLLAFSCYNLVKLVNPKKYINLGFLVISVITIAVSYDAIRNGQLNIMLTILAVFTAYNLSQNRYKTCIVLCILGMALKPYMAIPLLLITGLYPKKSLPTAIIGILIFIFAPFLLQSPHYVLEQYKNTLTVFQAVKEVGMSRPWADIFGLMKLINIHLSQNTVNIICVIIGIITYITSLLYFKKEKTVFGLIIMFLAVSYFLLFSQRTEMNTYCIAGPFMGFLIFSAFYFNKNKTKFIYIATSIICWILIFSANALSEPLAELLNTVECTWTAPFAYLIFFIYTLIYVIPKITENDFQEKFFCPEK